MSSGNLFFRHKIVFFASKDVFSSKIDLMFYCEHIFQEQNKIHLSVIFIKKGRIVSTFWTSFIHNFVWFSETQIVRLNKIRDLSWTNQWTYPTHESSGSNKDKLWSRLNQTVSNEIPEAEFKILGFNSTGRFVSWVFYWFFSTEVSGLIQPDDLVFTLLSNIDN